MTRFSVWFILLVVLSVACGGETAVSNQQLTAEALGASIVQTATAEAETVVQPAAAAEQAAAAATEQVVAAEATEVIVATEEAVAAEATEVALSPVQQELEALGLDPMQGELAWQHPPVLVEAEGYLEYNFANDFIGTVAADFVLAADITWNTQFGTTGCGFVVRSDGEEMAFNQYLVIATRGAEGHVLFFTQQDGEILREQSQDIYANGIDPLFEWQNDTTNRIVVVARGDQFTLYTNGTEIGQIEAEAGFDRGFVAFVALNESGYTRCQFDNAWLWQLN